MDEPQATSEVSKEIRAINKEAVHRICSGQIVLDLGVAVKELVENSIDSGATSVEVKLADYGQTCITVSDNGSGVPEQDFQGLGLKHHTSKLREFSDLTEIDTFGFRGEALSSLCSLSELMIITRHISSPYGFKLDFDKNGILQGKEVCARERGTTVIVRNIFKSLPVRAKEFQKNIKKEYAKAIQVLQGYCLVSTGIKINCINTTGNKSNTIVSTNGSMSILENITSTFGNKAKDGLMKIDIIHPDEATLEEFNLKIDKDIDFSWDFYISGIDHNLGRSSPDRQYFYINGRPCDLMKISKLINQIYHKYNMKQYPFVYLNLKLSQQCTDVNVTPDKRTIFLTKEKLVLATIKCSLTTSWEKTQGKFTVRSLTEFNFNPKKRSNTENFPELAPHVKRRSILPSNESVLENIKKEIITKKTRSQTKTANEKKTFLWGKRKENKSANDEEINKSEKEEESEKEEYEEENKSEDEKVSEKGEESEIEEESCKMMEKIHKNDVNNISQKLISLERIEKIPDVVMTISLAEIRQKFKHNNKVKDSQMKDTRIKYRVQLNSKNTSDAEKELQKELSKDSFTNMAVIGQFNLGFIIARLDDDLFIIDQHATDEKFRFEKLSKETKIKTQKLIVPKRLSLSALSETILLEHQSIFEDNGFTFNVNQEGKSGALVELTGMPVSGGWQFNQEDIEELIFLISEGGTQNTSNVPRPSKVRQMFASRACRSAVMIGTTLNMSDMRRLVDHMALMDQPWNCPHGRPTIRHLLSMSLLKK